MSAFDPLAALAFTAVAAAEQSIAEATLTLGDAAQVLQAQISVGDQIPATILPPANGQDLLSFLGQNVVAQLPPGLNPGETLLLQVTGFQGSQIVVRNLGVVDPQNLPPRLDIALPPQSADAPQRAVLTTQSPGVAPPIEVFVAASVRPATQSEPMPAPQSEPASLEPSAAPPVSPHGAVEARIAATRAVGPDSIVSIPNRTPASLGRAPIAAPSLPARTVLSDAPQLVPRAVAARSPVAPTILARATSPDEALLTRLRVPLTPITLAAAKAMGEAAQAIPRTFAALDRALAQLISADPRIAPLRSMLAFTGRLDPSNLRALPEQLASFVANVLDGAEAKLATIVSLLERGSLAQDLPEPTSAAPPAPNTSVSLLAPLPVSMQAHVAERGAALETDVKSVILSLLQSPPNGAPSRLTQALGQALTAVTALQLNVLNAQTINPQAIAIALPVFYREGGAPSHVRVTRDGANGQRLDRDNFHVAFILDTQTLGTVAIELKSAGRAVTVDVKTEGAPAAQRFSATLADLRGRLEGLHYHVASLAAAVASPHEPASSAPDSSGSALETNPAVQLDVRA